MEIVIIWGSNIMETLIILKGLYGKGEGRILGWQKARFYSEPICKILVGKGLSVIF